MHFVSVVAEAKDAIDKGLWEDKYRATKYHRKYISTYVVFRYLEKPMAKIENNQVFSFLIPTINIYSTTQTHRYSATPTIII